MNLGPRLRLPSFAAACVLTFLVASAYGPIVLNRIHNVFGLTTPPFQDLGYFIVAGNFPANGSSAPRNLVAGTWGDELNFTQAANATFTFYQDWGLANQTQSFSVNATIPRPMTVWLELGGPTLSAPCYLDVKWR